MALSTQDMLQGHIELCHHTFGFVKSMALKCAVDIGIPGAIQRNGGHATLSELLAKTALPPSRLPRLRRLMRVLTISGVFTVHQPAASGGEEAYGLTAASRLLVGDETSSCLSPLVSLILDRTLVVPFFSLRAWFMDERPVTFFEVEHGETIWEMAARDAVLNRTINDGMASDSRFAMEVILRENRDVFHGISSLVDVGGGKGAVATAIAKAFPSVKCSVLDLPHVVAQAPSDGDVQFISGDMFEYIPPADAVLLKSVLHDWRDDECVKILQRCKEAISSRDAGGKVIIINMVVGSKSQNNISKEAQVLYDLFLMAVEGGEREEHEWKRIFLEAGFRDYKIIPVLGIRSIIEVYP